MFYIVMDTIIGKLLIIEKKKKIDAIFFYDEENPEKVESIIEKETPLLKEAKRQLDLYFEGKLKEFDLPIKLNGTDFQVKVYKELMKIPYADVVTYKEIAKKVGNEKACRAVGNANNKNRIPIIIPCHRVIGSNTKLVGYASGIDKKEKLINLEKLYKK